MSDDYIAIYTHSDDCAAIIGRDNIDEYDFWDVWWPLMVDGIMVGEIKIVYGDGWETRLRGVNGHNVDILDDPVLLPPTDEDGNRIWPDDS